MESNLNENKITRRNFLRGLGLTGVALTLGSLTGSCESEKELIDQKTDVTELKVDKPVEIADGLSLVKADGLALDFIFDLQKIRDEKLELMLSVKNENINENSLGYYGLQLVGKQLLDFIYCDGKKLVKNNYTDLIKHKSKIFTRLILDPSISSRTKNDQYGRFEVVLNDKSWTKKRRDNFYHVGVAPEIYQEKMSDRLVVAVALGGDEGARIGYEKNVKEIYELVKKINTLVKKNDWRGRATGIRRVLFCQDMVNDEDIDSILTICPVEMIGHEKYSDTIIQSRNLLSDSLLTKKVVLYEALRYYGYYVSYGLEESLLAQYADFVKIEGDRFFAKQCADKIKSPEDLFSVVLTEMSFNFKETTDNIESAPGDEDRKILKMIIRSLLNTLDDNNRILGEDNVNEIKQYLER